MVANHSSSPIPIRPAEILDPNPERPTRLGGVRQHNRTGQLLDWEFKNDLPVTGSVVQPATDHQVQMTGTDVEPSGHTPVTANASPASRSGRPVTYWAVALSILACSAVSAALLTNRADPVRAIVTVLAVLVCSLVLIAAEQFWSRTR